MALKPYAGDFQPVSPAGSAALKPFSGDFTPTAAPGAAPKARLQRSWGEAAKDTGVGVVQGAVNLLGAAAQGYDMSPQGMAVRFAQEKALGAIGQRRVPTAEINANANAAIDEWKSPALRESQAALSETKGVLPTLKRLATDPKLVGQFAAEQVPMLAAMGTGTAVTASRAGATAAQNALTRGAAPNVAERYGGQVGRAMARRFNIGASGGLGAGFSGMGAEADALQQDDATWAKNPEFQRRVADGESPQSVKDSLAQRAGLVAGAIAGPVSAATGGLTARLETDVFTRNLPAAGARALLTRPGVAQVGGAVVREGAEEAVQEGAEQFAQNVGVRINADGERGLMEGVPEAATVGGTVGAVIGGGMGAAGTALSRPDGMQVQAPEGSLQQAVEQTQKPMLALPAPVIRVRPDGKAATESTIFTQQQRKQDRQQAEDAELVGERDALGLTSDVNTARSRHPGAVPNEPRLQNPAPRPGSLADAVQQEQQAAAPVANAGMFERQLAERNAAGPTTAPAAEPKAAEAISRPQSPPINLDPESGELLGIDADGWPNGAAHQQPTAIVEALKAEAARNRNKISGVTRITETYNVDKAIARQLRQRAIDQMNAEVGSPRRGEQSTDEQVAQWQNDQFDSATDEQIVAQTRAFFGKSLSQVTPERAAEMVSRPADTIARLWPQITGEKDTAEAAPNPIATSKSETITNENLAPDAAALDPSSTSASAVPAASIAATDAAAPAVATRPGEPTGEDAATLSVQTGQAVSLDGDGPTDDGAAAARAAADPEVAETAAPVAPSGDGEQAAGVVPRAAALQELRDAGLPAAAAERRYAAIEKTHQGVNLAPGRVSRAKLDEAKASAQKPVETLSAVREREVARAIAEKDATTLRQYNIGSASAAPSTRAAFEAATGITLPKGKRDSLAAVDAWAASPAPESVVASPVKAAGEQAATSAANDLRAPSAAQIEAGNYRKGHLRLNGHDVSIENPAGTRRRPEWPPLTDAYGYIRGTVGRDKDHVDVFMTEQAHDPTLPVFVVDQVNADGTFDEHKVVMGTASEADARSAYLRNYARGWTGLGGITEMTQDAFKAWVRDPNNTRKRADGAPIKPRTNPTAGDKGTSVQPTSAEASTAPARIDDFGETLHGARKHYAVAYAEQMKAAGEVDVVTSPLSQSWPEPDYAKLQEAGAAPKALAFARAARDAVPTKPKSTWKLKGWADGVKLLRSTTESLLAGDIPVERLELVLSGLRGEQLRDILGAMKLYEAVGHERSLKGLRLRKGVYQVYNGVKQPGAGKTMWSIERKAKGSAFGNWPTVVADGDSEAAVLEAFGKVVATEAGPKKRAPTRFDIYSRRGTDGYIVGKRIGKTAIDLKSFPDLKAAREYKASNQDELEQLLAKAKEVPAHRRDTNAPRVGIDHRSGGDVTPEQFAEQFGFRGVQFGNYVEGDRRQRDLNSAYDALMDLAGVLNVPPRALSLNGSLGLAFGARGKGGKNAPSAHFEQGSVVINLTKRGGPGALAHEWWHGLDNYFARQAGQKTGFATDKGGRGAAGETGLRPEMRRAFRHVMETLAATGLRARSAQLDQGRSKAYWATDIEMSARSFESYVIAKLSDEGLANDYLANVVREEAFGDRFPYVTADETPAVRAAFDDLFATIDSEQTSDGNVRLFSKAPVEGGPFVSALLESVEQGKGAPKSAPATAWKQWLDGAQRRGEIKREERDWLGVDSWLDDQDGAVARDQLAAYVRANRVQIRDVLQSNDTSTTSPAKYAEYVLPGGENYRELLLTLERDTRTQSGHLSFRSTDSVEAAEAMEVMLHEIDVAGMVELDYEADWQTERVVFRNWAPAQVQKLRELLSREGVPQEDLQVTSETEGADAYASSHFTQNNVLAHVRFNERRDADGRRVLFLEEVQSDWHQEGRRDGYGASGVPDAPFKTSWPLLAVKRMVRYAAEHGFDRVAWTTGDQQTARYDLSKHVREVEYVDGSALIVRDIRGMVVFNDHVVPAKIAEVIGKDAAERLLASAAARRDGFNVQTIAGAGVRMGGEGMRAFYDRILPAEVNKLAKRYGAAVTKGEIGTTRAGGRRVDDGAGGTIDVSGRLNTETVHALDVTPDMRRAALGGLPMFSASARGEGQARLTFDAALRLKADLTASWGENAPNVILVENAEQFPGFAKVEPDYRRGEGLFNGRNTIWINVGGIRTEQRFAQVLAHEALGHFGVENVVGSDWSGIVATLVRHDRDGTGTDAIQGAIADVHRRYGRLDPETFAKEVIAVMAERGARNGLVDRVIAAVRRWLRKHMPQMTWTDADVVGLLGQADSFLRAGRSIADSRRAVAAAAFSRQLSLSAFLRSAPIAEARSSTETRTTKQITDNAAAFVAAHGARAESPQLGTVQISRRGIKSSVAHGYGKEKIAAFELVPDVIRAGRIVDTVQDYSGPGQHRHIIAAPVRIDGKAHLMGVVVRKQEGRDAGFYLHEVVLTPKTQNPDGPSTARSDERSNIGGSVGAIANVLLDAFAGNRDAVFSLPPVQLRVDGRGERRIDMGGETFLDRAGSFYLVDGKGQPRDFLTLGSATDAALRTGGEIVIDPAMEGGRSTWSVVVPDVVVREAATGRPLFSKSAAEHTAGPDPSRPFAPTVDLNKIRLDKTPLKAHLKGGLDWLKQNGWLPMLPINYLVDYASPGQKAPAEFMRIRGLMDSYRGERHAKYSEHTQDWLAWASKNRKAADDLAKLMHDATLDKVDPSSAISEPLQFLYGGQRFDATPENAKMAIKEVNKQIRGRSGDDKSGMYAKINEIEGMTAAERARPSKHASRRAQFLKLPAKAQEIFAATRDAYKEAGVEWDNVLLESIQQEMSLAEARADRGLEQKLRQLADDGLEGEELAKARAAAEGHHARQSSDRAKANAARLRLLREEFEGMRMQGPYFPLARFGDYFVTVRDAENKLLYFDKFENSGQRDQFAQQVRAEGKKAGWKVKTGLMSNQDDVRGAVDATFMATIEETLGEHGATWQLKDAVWQRYLETLPGLSTRKHFIHRKGTAGYHSDALRGFGDHMFHASHQIAKLRYGAQLRNTVDIAREEVRGMEDSTQADMLVNELEHRLEWVLNPQGGSTAQKITSTAFLWNLAISPAAALVNWTQTPMLGIPILGARMGGVTKAAAAIARASADLTRSKDWHVANGLKGNEKRAMDEFLTRGLLDRTQSHMLAGVGDVGVKYSANREKWMNRLSWLFHHLERINRETTSLAAYRMAVASGLGHESAIDKAVELTHLIHFDMSNSARARYLQSDTAKVLMVHRSHSLNMSYRMLRDAHQMIRGETAEDRSIARQQFAGIMGMHALLAGVAGVPFYGLAMMAAGVFKDLLGDDDDERTPEDMLKGLLYEAMPKEVADLVLYGAPSSTSGLSLYNRIGFPDFFFRSPNRELEGKAEFDYWVSQILGPAMGMPAQVFTGVNHVRQGEFARGVESMLPKGVRDVLKSARYQREGVLSLRGDPIVDDLNAWELIGQGAGFAPFKVSEAYEQRSAKTSLQTRILVRRSKIMNRYALGAKQQDPEMMREAIRDLQKFNRAYPEVAITPDGLRQSVKVRAARSERNQLGGMVLDQRLERRIGQDLGY